MFFNIIGMYVGFSWNSTLTISYSPKEIIEAFAKVCFLLIFSGNSCLFSTKLLIFPFNSSYNYSETWVYFKIVFSSDEKTLLYYNYLLDIFIVPDFIIWTKN